MTRMTDLRGKSRGGAPGAAKPVLIGTGVAAGITLLLVGAVSLVLLLIRSITQSSVLPLALVAAGAGCLLGGFVCGRLERRRGTVYGALVGLAVFVIITLIGVCFTKPVFGTETAVKFVVLVLCGSFGGYTGSRRRRPCR